MLLGASPRAGKGSRESATGISINCLSIQRVALDTDAVTPIGFEPVSNGEDANCVTWKGNEKDAG